MKKKLISQSGLFNPRVLLGLSLCLVGVFLSMLSFAGTASIGKFSRANPKLTGTNNNGKVTSLSLASSPMAVATPTPPPGAPRYMIYMSPPGVGDSAGEPSIGSNWTKEAISHNHNINGSINNIPNGGTSLYFGGFLASMLKITWDDCSSPAGTIWDTKPLISANTARAFGDPILFTDHDTGRTFCGQLEGLTPAGCTIDITDNDGDMFIPSDGVIPSDVDHETIGAGPYHSPLPNPNPVYAHATYYASQSVGEARTLRSDNGGIHFLPATTPMYTNLACDGLHGHVKVAPDGTVYVPNKGCGGADAGTPPFFHLDGNVAAVFSEDNGITWTVSQVPDSTTQSEWDSSIGIASDGTVYLGYQGKDGHARIAVGHHTPGTPGMPGSISWSASFDVGAQLGINNIAFPAVVAGDPNRASFAFFGTTTADGPGQDHSGGPNNDPTAFTGIWFLCVATTFDGGQTWFTQNITPGDPIQRGPICGGSTCRNLLDFFDATIDKEGRVLIGYDDGCVSAGCIAGTSANDFTAKAAIARQSGGKRMFTQFDPIEPAVPGAPATTGSRNSAGDTATLSWPAPDNGGSSITSYKVYRKTDGAATFNLVAIVPVTTYSDPTLTPGVQYTYHVTAVNAAGEGPYCPDLIPGTGGASPCVLPGILAVNDLNSDGSDNDSGQNTPPDPRVNVRQLFMAEPFLGPGVNRLVFTMQMAPSPTLTSPPASSQWYIVWNRQMIAADGSDRFYVAMKTDATGAESFEYGNFGPPLPLDGSVPPANANTPTRLGSADSGNYNVATGVITITLSDSVAENIHAGQSLGALNVRTFFARPDTGQKSQNNASDITPNGDYTLIGNAACQPPVHLLSAVSRKTHGTAGTFDIDLLPPNPGIECRVGGATSGNHTIVFTFANPLASVAGASVTSGTGSISSSTISSNGFEYIVNLTGVTNAQRLTVTLTGITDTGGNGSATLSATMGVLLGDVDASGRVDSTDVFQVRQQTLKNANSSNFRTDVDVSGRIDSTDVFITRQQTLTSLP
jgi:fibronectin type III domain protein/dockerin type I repeat protein